MAEGTIDNLSIQVTASASKAARVFDRLASSADKLKGAAQGAADEMHNLADAAKDAGTATQKAAEQSGEAQKKIRGTGKAAKETGDNAKKGANGLSVFWNAMKRVGSVSFKGIKGALFDLPRYFGGKLLDNVKQAVGGIGQFFSSLKRIAFYRAIRSALKLITQGFSEGMKNLYAWSSAVNGSFAASMDKLATASLYLKNSFAAMVSPLVEALAPAVDFVVDKFVNLFNVINQVFAVLAGKTSYTAAKKVAQQWQDASDSASGSARRAANEIKRTILGFDEINKLNGDNGRNSSSGSGANNSNNNAALMFENRSISSWITDMVNGGDYTVLGKKVAEKINGVFNSIDWNKIGQTVANGLKTVTTAINGFIYNFDWGGFGITIAQGLNTIVDGLILWFEGIDWAALGRGIGNTLNKLIRDINWGNIGTLINDKIKALFDFTENLVITFDPIEAANSIRELLGQIKWKDLADQMWRTAGMAFDKAADFIVVLFGGDTKIDDYFKQGKKSPITRIANAIGKALGEIDWKKILSIVGKAFWEAFTGLVEGLWNSEHGKVFLTLSMAIVGLKFAIPPLIKGLSTKVATSIAGVGTEGAAAWASTGKVLGNAALLAFDGMMVAYDVSKIKEAAQAYEEAGTAYGKEISNALTNYESIYRTKGKDVADAWAMQVYGIDTTNTDLEGAQKLLADRIETLWGDAPKNWWEALKKGFDEYFGENGKGLKALFGDGVQSFADWLGVDLNPKAKNVIAEGLRGFFSAGLGGPVGSLIENTGNLLQSGNKGGTKAVLNAVVNAVPGKNMNTSNGALTPNVKNSSSVNKVLASAGSGMVKANNTVSAVVSDTYSTNTIVGEVGRNMKEMNGRIQAIVANTTTTNTVSALAGYAMQKGYNSSNGLAPMVEDIDRTVTVYALAGTGLEKKHGSLEPIVEDIDTQTVVDAIAGNGMMNTYGDALAPIVENARSTVDVDMWTPWQYWGVSALRWMGLENLRTTVVVDITTGAVRGAVGGLLAGFGRRAKGGVYVNGGWSDIPQYAGGTTNAGSLFVAGEAGPEIVGHVGGRTEVLNKSQIASAIYSAVQAAMAPATSYFAAAAQSISESNVSFDLEMLAEMVRQGVEQAMSRSNDYDRQKVELLRSINEKDFDVDVSTSSINRSQNRMNRRAGTTIVPVGT